MYLGQVKVLTCKQIAKIRVLLKLRRHFMDNSHVQVYWPDKFSYLRQSSVEEDSAHNAQDTAQGKSKGSAHLAGDGPPEQTA